jgi:hypothetical protein
MTYQHSSSLGGLNIETARRIDEIFPRFEADCGQGTQTPIAGYREAGRVDGRASKRGGAALRRPPEPRVPLLDRIERRVLQGQVLKRASIAERSGPQ